MVVFVYLSDAFSQRNSIITQYCQDSGYPVGGGGAFSYSEEQVGGGEDPWGVQFSPVRTNGPATAEGGEDYENGHDDVEYEEEDEDEDQRFAGTFRPSFLTVKRPGNEQFTTNSSEIMR